MPNVQTLGNLPVQQRTLCELLSGEAEVRGVCEGRPSCPPILKPLGGTLPFTLVPVATPLVATPMA